MVRVPVIVAVKPSLSDDPAVVDLTWNVALKFKVPVAPLYLPVPAVTVATPLVTVTGVGVVESAPQAWAEFADWGETVIDNVEPPPERVPLPLMGSHSELPVKGAVPVPASVAVPMLVAVPEPVTEVALTEELAHKSASVPEIEAVNATFFVVTFA